MKVLSTVLVALVMVVGGLTVASPASAKPYPHTVPTVCKAVPKPATIRVGARPAVAFRILVSGYAHPKARVDIKAVRTGTRQVMWTTSKYYPGHRAIWLLKRLPKGQYKIKFRTSFRPQSIFMDCRTRYTLTVRR